MHNSEIQYYDFDGFRVDIKKHQLLKNGEPILLTPKAFQILQILIENSGQVVEREDIYAKLWANSFVEESNLTQYIYTLRKTLGKNPSGDPYIETVARRGYIFSAQVEKVFSWKATTEAPSETVSRENDSPSAAESETSQKIFQTPAAPELNPPPGGQTSDFPKEKHTLLPDFRAKNRGLSKNLFLTGLFLVLIIVSSLFIYFQTEKDETKTPAAVNSIAILPFQPIDEESREEKLGLGMAHAIIMRFTKLKKIPVRPTSAIFRFTDQPAADVITIGRELNVDAILEGTVQRDGEHVRVSVQLINVSDGKLLWTEKFDEKFTDIFALQDSISGKVPQSLSLKLTPLQLDALQQRPTNNPEAYEAYQLGVYFWNTRTKENLQKAVAHFQKAIDLDPNFASPYALLADTYNMLGYYGFADSVEMNQKSFVAADKALDLDNSVAEAYMAKAFIQSRSGNYEAAEALLEKAIEFSPYNSTVRVRHGWTLFALEKIEQAVAEMRLATEYDPLSPVSNGALCNMLIYRENFAEAVKLCEKAVELSPNTADNRLVLANAYFFKGETEKAIELAKIDFKESRRRFSSLGNIGYFYAKLGRRSEAEEILVQLIPETGKDSELFNDLALINYALGKKEESLKYLQKASEKKVLSRSSIRHDPAWKEIRQDSRFIELIK